MLNEIHAPVHGNLGITIGGELTDGDDGVSPPLVDHVVGGTGSHHLCAANPQALKAGLPKLKSAGKHGMRAVDCILMHLVHVHKRERGHNDVLRLRVGRSVL